MEHKLIFYPVGNGDCCLLQFDNGKNMIIDFNHTKACEDKDCPKINLREQVKKDLNGKNKIDVLALTHIDEDHIDGIEECFELLCHNKYCEGDRIKFKELWLPACAVTEQNLTGTAKIIRDEARYRLKNGLGIKVFSATEKFKEWLEDNNIDKESIDISYPGEIVKNSLFSTNDSVTIFCHTPFKKDGEEEIRNKASVILHFSFNCGKNTTKYLAMGDTDWDVISELYERTAYKNNLPYLEWDIFNIPHHCSYRGLSSEKGTSCTKVDDVNVDSLLKLGRENSIMIASCNPVEKTETEQPPHIQAQRCYLKYCNLHNSKFLVTMEYPNKNSPLPIKVAINENGYQLEDIYNKTSSERFGDYLPKSEIAGLNRFG